MMGYHAAVKTARMVVVRDAVDQGSGPGTLEIGTAGMAAVLATITLADPCGAVAGDVLTFSGFPKSVPIVADGEAAAARIKDSNGTVIRSGLTVGVATGDVQLETTTLAANSALVILLLTINHAP
jgi:hypothetical protein